MDYLKIVKVLRHISNMNPYIWCEIFDELKEKRFFPIREVLASALRARRVRTEKAGVRGLI